jgi:hypothetical protein
MTTDNRGGANVNSARRCPPGMLERRNISEATMKFSRSARRSRSDGEQNRTAVLMLALAVPAPWALHGREVERETLKRVLILARLDRANLPITLTAVVPPPASRGIEAWTSYGADERGERIFVCTGSDIFRCASRPLGMRQCVVRLASALVHEAWHFEHGRNERDAYEAQIGFLLRNGAATEHVKAVGLAQNRVIATQRRAADDAWQELGSSGVAP